MKSLIKLLLAGVVLILATQSCTEIKAQHTDTPQVATVIMSGDSAVVPLVQTPTEGVYETKVIRLKAPKTMSAPLPQSYVLEAPTQTVVDDIELKVVFSNPQVGQNLWTWAKSNWVSFVAILLFIIQVATNLTPSDKDNSIFLVFKRIFEYFVPNVKTGGGTHP
jgi:hypothetical protein